MASREASASMERLSTARGMPSSGAVRAATSAREAIEKQQAAVAQGRQERAQVGADVVKREPI